MRRACLVLASTATVAACSKPPEAYQESFLAMDSTVSISIAGASEDSARAAILAVRAEVERLESVLSDYRPQSNVSRLNRRETDIPEPETLQLLERAQRACRETGGAFDVSLRPIKHLWGFGTGLEMHVPDSSAVGAALAHVGCEVYALTSDGRLVWNDDAAEIDLGGIAQGYVAGRMAEILRRRGIDDFLIDVSGDILANGDRPGGGPWRIAIQDPRRPERFLAKVTLANEAITTSGDYEQFFEAGGVRYHHIFDPRTGWPARGAVAVSVRSTDPVDADCFATAVFVLGPERGLAFLEARPDLSGAVVHESDTGRLETRWSDGGRP